jgi:hypothetical protein
MAGVDDPQAVKHSASTALAEGVSLIGFKMTREIKGMR